MATSNLGFELTAYSSVAESQEVPPSGNHAARIVGLVDGGTHLTPGTAGSPRKQVPKYLLILELPLERRADGNPFVVLFECTASLYQGAHLRKVMEAVLGRPIADGEWVAATELVGRPASVTIAHEARGDRAYFKIASIGPAVRGLQVPEQHYPTLVWSIAGGQPFPEADWLPRHFGRTVPEWVAESRDYRAAAPKAAHLPAKPPTSPIPTDCEDIAY
jgi:hypothetical protein